MLCLMVSIVLMWDSPCRLETCMLIGAALFDFHYHKWCCSIINMFQYCCCSSFYHVFPIVYSLKVLFFVYQMYYVLYLYQFELYVYLYVFELYVYFYVWALLYLFIKVFTWKSYQLCLVSCCSPNGPWCITKFKVGFLCDKVLIALIILQNNCTWSWR